MRAQWFGMSLEAGVIAGNVASRAAVYPRLTELRDDDLLDSRLPGRDDRVRGAEGHWNRQAQCGAGKNRRLLKLAHIIPPLFPLLRLQFRSLDGG
jgi:hypothetical protein